MIQGAEAQVHHQNYRQIECQHHIRHGLVAVDRHGPPAYTFHHHCVGASRESCVGFSDAINIDLHTCGRGGQMRRRRNLKGIRVHIYIVSRHITGRTQCLDIR